MRRAPATAGAVVVAIAVAAVAGTTADGTAVAAACGSTVSVAQLRSGCTTASGTLVLPDGRRFRIPPAGTTVTAAPVAAVGAADPGDVSVTNTGRTGVAVVVDGLWSGSTAAVRQERAAVQRRTLAGSAVRPLGGQGATTAANCGSGRYAKLGYRWRSAVSWRYDPTGQKVSGASAIGAGAGAWTGSIRACGTTVRSGASETYRGTVKQATGVRADGGCGASNGSSVVGWGSLSGGTLAVTCVWSRSGVAVEVDQRYSTKHAWSSTAKCSGSRYDLRGIATHEWGHAFGLGHTPQGDGLVMKPASGPCDLGQRALGLGDVRGIAAVG